MKRYKLNGPNYVVLEFNIAIKPHTALNFHHIKDYRKTDPNT